MINGYGILDRRGHNVDYNKYYIESIFMIAQYHCFLVSYRFVGGASETKFGTCSVDALMRLII